MKNNNKLMSLKWLAVAGVLFSTTAFADPDFYGRVESRPQTDVGLWVVSGQQVQVTNKTTMDYDEGPAVVGSCVEVDHEKGVASEIETHKPEKCTKRNL